MPAPEKTPLYLGFKIDEETMHVFHIIGWKVKADHKVLGGTCTCPVFKFESSCPHAQLAAEPVVYVVASASKWHAAKTSEATKDVMQDIYVIRPVPDGTPDVGRLSRDIKDISLFDLAFLLLKDDAPKATDGQLNPRRIYKEACLGAELGVGLQDGRILSAGKAVPKSGGMPEPEPVPDFGPGSTSKPRFHDAEPAKPVVRPSMDWKKVAKPDPGVFYVDGDVWEQLVYCKQKGENVLLTGPSGSGKSQVIYHLTAAMSLGMEPFNMGAMSEPRSSLIGNTHFSKEKGTWFTESRFVRAVQKEGSAILLDEVTRSDRSAFNILLPLLDDQGYLALDESEDSPIIRRAAAVSFFGTANVGMEYTGTEAIDKALKERFQSHIDMSFPPESAEVAVLRGRCDGLSLSEAAKLVKLATTQRLLARDGDFVEQISTRMLLAAGRRIAHGMSFKLACKFAIENLYSADGGEGSERTRIKQMIQKEG